MATPSSSVPVAGEQIPVIDPRFCFPHPIELAIKQKTRSTTILNDHGDIVFTLKVPFFSNTQVLGDVAGNPILTMKPKVFSWHARWRVFRGESTDSQHLLFSLRNSPAFFSSDLDVFLASNTEEKIIDFKIKRSWRRDSCTIYKGQSDIIIAHMSKKRTSKNILKRKTPIVTIYAGVDSAFIVALILILLQKDDDAAASATSASAAGASS